MSDKRRSGSPEGEETATGGVTDGDGQRASASRGTGAEEAAKARPKRKSKTAPREKSPRKAATRKTETPSVEPTAEQEDAAAAAARSKQPSKKLPAFGFAEDLISAEKKPTSSAETDDDENPGADPDRIFAFADRLEAETRESPQETVPVRLSTWVTFSLDGEVFALPVEPVREVLRVASITRVPHAPDPIRGVTNVRGRVIPVIDLRLRIGIRAADLNRSSRVIVVRSRGRRLGFLVDAVHQVAHIDLNRVQPPPEDVMTIQSDYITGVYHLGEELVLMLNVDRALVVQGSVPGALDSRPPEPAGFSGSSAAAS